ncbi:MAG: hypothetical protein E6I76_17260 [Chloroflexi bacterium]|nr:MAG: hypothetical protein E6I76_17260 [Chloroflexota bacterium]
MSPADVLSPVDATAAVERAVAELLGGAPADGDAELCMLDAIAGAAARLAAQRRPERRAPDGDAPVGIAGWWSFAAQVPEIEY